MEWSPPPLTGRPKPQNRVLSMRHCWFGSPATNENQMEATTIAIDLATRVFQIHYVDPETGTIHSKVLKRAQLVPFFANRPASRVVMEACGSAHYWERVLTRFGHDVWLIAAQFVRPFVKSNKNDAADAAAIWEAAQRPGMRFVAVKTEDQQAMCWRCTAYASSWSGFAS
jgi:transposase